VKQSSLLALESNFSDEQSKDVYYIQEPYQETLVLMVISCIANFFISFTIKIMGLSFKSSNTKMIMGRIGPGDG